MIKFNKKKYFKENVENHLKVIESIKSLENEILKIIDKLTNCLQNKNKLIFCGNGGSAADCQHLAAEFTGRFTGERRPLAALALTTDTSALTCISNDYSFSDVFSRQLLALGLKGDALVAISTSGSSINIINAVNKAQEIGIYTIGLVGKDGGKLKDLCDLSIIIPSNETARIQEAHILVGHIICGAVERNLGLVEL